MSKHTFAFLLFALAACGEKIGEDPFESITDTGSSGASGETAGESGTAGTTTSAGTTGTTTNTTTTSTESGASESGPVDCSTCVAAPPEGWFGPVALAFGSVGDDAIECVGAYSESSLTLLSGYHDPGPAECECTCELQASFCTTYMYEHNTNACTGPYSPFVQPSDTCMAHAFTQGWTNVYMFQQGNPFCQAMVTETIPEVEWDTLVSSCGLPDPLACDNGDVCVPPTPEGFDGAACIFQEGEQACPAGDFSVQKVFYTGVEDDRDCTNCGCGQGTGSCSGAVDIFSSNDCSGDPISSAPGVNNQYGPCTVSTGGQSVQLDFTGMGSCPIQTAPMPEGTIAPVGAFTYCCMG